MGLAAQEALKQPTWCRLSPDKFPVLEARAHATAPENLLFTYKSQAAAASAGSNPASQLGAAHARDARGASASGTGSPRPQILTSAAADGAVKGREARELDPASTAVTPQQAAGSAETPRKGGEAGLQASLTSSRALTPDGGGQGSAAARR